MASSTPTRVYKLTAPIIWPDVSYIEDYEWWRKKTIGDSYRDTETLAYEFPSRKPDTNICLPVSSRTYRGWFAVKRPRTAGSYPPDPISSPSYYPANASTRTPPELFDIILENIAATGKGRVVSPPLAIPFLKRELASCASVCRYWASVCRRKLFYAITLRSLDDVITIKDSLRNPNSHLVEYVAKLDIEVFDMQAGPWIHLVPGVWSQLRVQSSVAASLRGPLPPNLKGFRSIHQALPRVAPCFSRPIRFLTLTNIHFSHPENLIRLVGELPKLTTLDCIGVTWDPLETRGSPALKETYRGRSLSDISQIRIAHCSPDWARVVALLHTRLYNQRICLPFFDTDTLDGIVNIIRSIEVKDTNNKRPQCYQTSFQGRAVCNSDVFDDQSVVSFLVSHFLFPKNADPGLFFKDNTRGLEPLTVLQFVSRARSRSRVALVDDLPAHGFPLGLKRAAIIDIVAVTITIPRYHLPAQQLRWEELDTHLSAFPRLAHVTFGLRSVSDLKNFCSSAIPRMPLLQASDKLRFGVFSIGAPRDGRYQKTSFVDGQPVIEGRQQALWQLYTSTVSSEEPEDIFQLN